MPEAVTGWGENDTKVSSEDWGSGDVKVETPKGWGPSDVRVSSGWVENDEKATDTLSGGGYEPRETPANTSPYLSNGYGSEFPDAEATSAQESVKFAQEPTIHVHPDTIRALIDTSLATRYLPEDVKQGAAEEIAKLGSALTSPLSVGIIASAPVTGPLAGILAIPQIWDGLKRIYKASAEGNRKDLTGAIIGYGAGVVGVAGMAEIGKPIPELSKTSPMTAKALADTGVKIETPPIIEAAKGTQEAVHQVEQSTGATQTSDVQGHGPSSDPLLTLPMYEIRAKGDADPVALVRAKNPQDAIERAWKMGLSESKTAKVTDAFTATINPEWGNVPPPESPRLLPGENQGDLISSTQAEDFALSGEKGIDFEKIQAEKEASLKAKEESEKQQLNMSLDTPETPKPGPIREMIPTDEGFPLLDAIKELGGIAHPDQPGKARAVHGGEYDGFTEAIGTGKLPFGKEHPYVRSKGGASPDDMRDQLSNYGFDFDSTSEMWDSIGKALEGQRQRKAGTIEEAQHVFQEAIFENRGRSAVEQKKVRTINSRDLQEGDKLTVRGREFEVQGIDPDTGEVTLKDGPKFKTQNVPDGAPLHVEDYQPAPREAGEGFPIGEGPGAHTAGAAPLSTGTQLQQLTDTIRDTKPSPPGTYGLKAKLERAQQAAKDWYYNLVSKTPIMDALGKVRAKSAALLDDYLSPPRWNGLDEATGRWHLADSEASLDARRFIQEFNKAIPDKTRSQAIVDFIQAEGDDALLAKRAAATKDPALKRGYETARTLTPDEIVWAHQVGAYFDARLAEAQAAGIMEQGIDNYITQVWDRENPVTQSLRGDLALGKLQTNFKYAKQRIFDSYFEGEQAGFKPKNKDIGSLIALYDQALNRSISSRAYVRQIYEGKMPNGDRMATLQGSGEQVQMPLKPNQLVNDRPYFIKPDSMNAVTSDGRPYVVIDHPALRKWKWVGKAPDSELPQSAGAGLTAVPGTTPGRRNNIYLQADMAVHPDIYTELRNVLGKSALRDTSTPVGKVGKALLDLQMTAKQTKLDLSAFHLVQEAIHAGGHLTSPFKLEPIDLNVPEQAGLVKHGLQVADFKASELFSEGLSGGNRSLLQKIPGVGAVLGKWNEFLFKDFIPELKMKTAQAILKRNTETYGGRMSEDQLYALSAQQANAAYGELNYRMMYRNPTFQDILRLGLLAPDFLEARGKVVAQALKPYGNEQRMNLALIAGTMYIAARILNKTLDGDPHWDKPFTVIADKREYGVRTLVGDLQHLGTDPRSFAYNRMSPGLRVGTEFVTGRDDRGVKRSYWEQFKDAVGWAVPISLDKRDDTTRSQQLAGAFGIRDTSATATQAMYKAATDWALNSGDKKIAHEAKRRDVEAYEESDYRPLRVAIQMENEKGARLAYQKMVDEQGKTPDQIAKYFDKDPMFTGSQGKERAFKASLSARDRKTYQEAIDEHAALKSAFHKLFR